MRHITLVTTVHACTKTLIKTQCFNTGTCASCRPVRKQRTFHRKTSNIYTSYVPRSLHRTFIHRGRSRTASRRRRQARAACFHVRAHEGRKVIGPPHLTDTRLNTRAAFLPLSAADWAQVRWFSSSHDRWSWRLSRSCASACRSCWSRRAWEREGLVWAGLRRSEPITGGASQRLISAKTNQLHWFDSISLIYFFHYYILPSFQFITACVLPGYPWGLFLNIYRYLYLYINIFIYLSL